MEMGLESFDATDLLKVMKTERSIFYRADPTKIYNLLGNSATTDDEWKLNCESIFKGAVSEKLTSWDLENNKYIDKKVSSYTTSVRAGTEMRDLARLANTILDAGVEGLSPKEKELFYDIETTDGVKFKITLEFLFGSANGVHCVKSSEVELMFRFLTKATGDSNKNIQAVLANVPVVMIPVDKYGRTGFYTGLGDLKKPKQGGTTNPNNVEVAQRDDVFCNAEGKISGGTHQAIFILTEDCAAPNLNSIDIYNVNSLNNSRISSDISDVNYLGGHVLANSLPLSVFDGNPNSFGPLLLGETTGSQDKYKQVLVNRGYRSFSAGQRVVCCKVDGEWLLPIEPDLEAGVPLKPFKIERWGPTTYMSSSVDGYFRDNNYQYRQGTGNPNAVWTHVNYEISYRDNFYSSATTTDIDKALNPVGTSEFIPSDKYWQYTSFDMMNKTYGGINEHNLLGSSNPHIDSLGQPRDVMDIQTAETQPFSGMVATHGYSSDSVTELETKIGKAGSGIDSEWYLGDSSDSFGPDVNLYGDIATFNSGNFSFNNNAYHIPLDIGLNASETGVNGSPILKLKAIKNYFRRAGSGRYSDLGYESNIFNFDYWTTRCLKDRYVWCKDDDGNSFYDLKMVSNNKVTFIPLTGDVMTSPAINGLIGSDIGKFFTVGSTELFNTNFAIRERLLNGDLFLSQNAVQWGLIPFGPFVSNFSSRPYSNRSLSSQPFSSEGSYNVGIITTKATITTTASSINFTGSQLLGVPQQRTSTAGQVGPILIIGSFIIHGSSGSGGTSNEVAQWGTSSDRISDMNTSVLYARVFDYWPDDQTIFDPRYFSVLHFNPGELYEPAEVRDGVIKHSEVEYINSIPDTVRFKGNVENNEPSLTTDIEEYNPENINSVYDVDVLKFNIDHRVPTSHARDILDLGEPVYSDSLVRRKEHYNVDTSRRGKLLPYKWQRNTIALRMVFIDPNKIGVNYAKGDTFVPFGTHGTGGLVRVDTVDSSGGITDVSIVEHGQDFDVRDFLRSDHGTALVQNLTLVEETVQSGGSGAALMFAVITRFQISVQYNQV